MSFPALSRACRVRLHVNRTGYGHDAIAGCIWGGAPDMEHVVRNLTMDSGI